MSIIHILINNILYFFGIGDIIKLYIYNHKENDVNKTAVVVVTFNRKELLKKNITALLSQSRRDFDIIIIDNASTDGTAEHVGELVKKNGICYITLDENIGGAGGFNTGIKTAVTHGYEYIWLMDDDTYPEPDALEKLFEADRLLGGSYGFLSGKALWRDGSPCRMNEQKLLKYRDGDDELVKNGIARTNYATFVSFFLKTETVKKAGLPIKEFFIWGDDVEYSGRIADSHDCYVVNDSRVLHDTQNNAGSNIAIDDSDRLSRYHYAYRNEMYIARRRGIKGIVRQLAKITLHIVRVLFRSKNNRFKKWGIILKSSVAGIRFNPAIEYIGD